MTKSEGGSSVAPVAAAERITNLDTVRGIATLGILVMNAVSFGLVDAAYFNLDAGGTVTGLDRVIGLAGEVFADQKMMALFSLLFGVGIVVFVDRAEAKGRHPMWLSLWRNALLLAIGLLHSLVWDGDILVVYAVCAPLVLLLRNRRPRTLLVAGAGLVLLAAVAAVVAQQGVSASGEELGEFWYSDASDAEVSDGVGIFLYLDFFLRAIGMMLIGVALYRYDIVTGARPAGYYRAMAWVGLGLGLPLAAAGAIWHERSGHGPEAALSAAALNTLATIPVALGYLALITLWNQRPTSPAHLRVRAVGQMALTNYLAQTILGVLVLGTLLADADLTRTGIAAFVVVVWVLQLSWSQPWLQHFRFGPVEWVWRCGTYRSLQPLRRR